MFLLKWFYTPRIWSRPWSRPSTKGKIEHLWVSTAGGGIFFHYSEIVHTVILSLLEIWGFTPTVGGDPGGESLEKNRGVPLTVRGTFLERKTEGSPPLWGGLFGGKGDSWGGLGVTNSPTRKWSMYIPMLVWGYALEHARSSPNTNQLKTGQRPG